MQVLTYLHTTMQMGGADVGSQTDIHKCTDVCTDSNQGMEPGDYLEIDPHSVATHKIEIIPQMSECPSIHLVIFMVYTVICTAIDLWACVSYIPANNVLYTSNFLHAGISSNQSMRGKTCSFLNGIRNIFFSWIICGLAVPNAGLKGFLA